MTRNRFASLMTEPPAPEPAAPTVQDNRFGGLLERVRAPETDAGAQFDDAFDLATQMGAPLGTIEAFYPEIAADRDRMAAARPADPLDVGPVEQTPDVRIGLREQIDRMETVDWLKRMPLSPAGAIDAAELAIAADRLRKNDYARIAEQEVWAGSPRILAGPGKGSRVQLEPEERARRLAETETFWRDRDAQKIEQYLLDRLEVASRGQTFAAKVFEGLSYLPAWMIEFSLTGGLNQIGSETAKDLALRTLQGYASTTGGRAVLKAAGWTGGAITRATLGMPHRVTEQILERRISEVRLTDDPDNPVAFPVAPESWATSIAKGWGHVVIEVASEQAGEGLTAGTKWLSAKTIGRLPFGSRYYEGVRQAWLSLHPENGAAAAFAERFFRKAGYDGLLAELGEERLATVLHALAGTQDFGLGPEASPLDRLVAGMKQDLQLKNLAVEATVLAVPGATRAAIAAGGRAYVRSQLVPGVAGEGAEATPGRAAEEPSAVREESKRVPAAPQGGRAGEQAQGQVTPEAPAEAGTQAEPSVWDEAVASAEAEAAAQAAERYQGPSEFVYEDLLPALEGREMRELRRMGRALGVRISGASKDTYAKFIADAVVTLTKTEDQPPPMIEGEPHPGSVSFGKFMDRYGEVLSWPDNPGHAEWNARYGRMESEGMRGLHRRLQHEWHKINAWALFHQLTGQTAPPPPMAAQAAAGATDGPSGEPVDPDWPRTQNEAADLETELAAAETVDAANEYAGQAAPADLAADPVEPGVSDVGFIRRLLHNWGIRSADGYEPLAEKDFREIFKFVQMPADIARTFPQFMGVYKVQMAREIAKQVLDRHFAEKLTPYFDLSNAERRPVDELLVAMEQHPGDSAIAGPLLAKLTAEQYAGYQAVREALDDAAEMLIARMREAGVPEERLQDFAARIGSYIPHKWYGTWAVVVREKMTSEQMKKEGRRPSTEYMSAVGRRQRFAERDRLGKLFPNAEIEVLKRTNVPYEAFQDAPAWAVSRMVDLVIEQAETKVPGRPDMSEDAKAQLREAFKDLYKAKGFGMHFIQRKETPGWTEDLRKPLAGYFAGFSGFLTKMEAAFAFAEAIEDVDPRRTPNLYKYASQYVRYVMGDESEFGLFKQVLYRYYLYGNLKSAVTNLTGNLVLGWPVLSKHTSWPLPKLLVAMTDTAAGRLSAAEKTFLTGMEEAGYLDPKLSQEISARGGNAIYRQLKGPIGKTISFFDFFRHMERLNRRSMAVALHRAGFVEPAAVNELVEEAHFHYAKGNRPTLARGMSSPLMVFRSFTINQCTWIKNEITAGRVSPLARHMLAWTLIGGLKAMPFAGPLVLLYARLFKRDPEGDARELMGRPAAETLFRGLPSQGGVSMTGSVGMLDIVPTIEPGQSWTAGLGEWIGGVAADIPARLGRVSKDLASGQYLRALEDASPEALRNPLAAWRLYTRGARTRSGRPILDIESHTPMHLTEAEAALKAMGFSPDRVKQQYDISQILAAISGERQMLKQHWADRFYLAALQKDLEGMQEVLVERDGHEASMRAKGRPDLVIPSKELDGMVRSRLQPVNLPDKSMIETYARIWRQYYGESENEK